MQEPTSNSDSQSLLGILSAVSAFVMIGIVPVYFKNLSGITADEVFAHRIIWAFIFLIATFLVGSGFRGFIEALLDVDALKWMLMAAIINGVNNFIFVWAAMHSRILDASFGYLLSPLFTMVLGYCFNNERFNGLQKAAIAISAVAVTVLTYSEVNAVWLTLSLGIAFSLYGFAKKRGQVPPNVGLMVEQLLLIVPAAGYLAFLNSSGLGKFAAIGPEKQTLLIVSGLIAPIPLLLFSFALKRIELSTAGIIQYLGPALLLGVGLFYGESLSPTRMTCLVLIMMSVVLYTVASLRVRARAVTVDDRKEFVGNGRDS